MLSHNPLALYNNIYLYYNRLLIFLIYLPIQIPKIDLARGKIGNH